jgi:hypothetical protein
MDFSSFIDIFYMYIILQKYMTQIALQNLELANKFGISLQVVQSWFKR